MPSSGGHPKRFIVIEGLDGVGKTAVGTALAARLGGRYLHTPPELFGPIRAAVDRVASPQTRFLFYLSAVSYASQQFEEMLAQMTIVCDRYIASTIAYQGAMDDQLLEIVRGVELLQPDITFYLVADEAVRRRRLAARSKPCGHADQLLEDATYLARVDALYRAQPGIEVVDTTRSGIEEIADELAGRVLALRAAK
jgi:thymidylate kinase